MDSAFLKINDKIFGGWKSFTISQSIETIAGSFRLAVTDKWSDQKDPWPILPGDKCSVFIGEDKLITGYVDSVDTTLSANDRTITISGRDMTADLVDCSIDYAGGEIYNTKLEKICEKLFKPFGINVIAKTSTGTAITMARITNGESVFELVEKKAREKGLLFLVNSEGGVDISAPGSDYASTALIQGVNLLSCQASFDYKDRFSVYKVKAQNGFEGSGTNGFTTLGKASDAGVSRYRPLVINGETILDIAGAKKRAEYEAIVRASRSMKVNCSVQGFRQYPDGPLWKLNQLVRFDAPLIGVESTELLISSLEYTLDDNSGSVTSIGLMRKDAFIPVPEVPKKNEFSLGQSEGEDA